MFAEANIQAGFEAYRLYVVASQTEPLRSSSGVRIMPDRTIGPDFGETIDTLLVAGCPNSADVPADRAVIDWLRQQAPLARRYGSVCSGAFFLAAAGLLDGRRVTTHWAVAANPGLDHSVANMAGRMDLSPRHFARLFRAEVGVTPAAWVEEARVSAARRLLEQGTDAPKQVAARCGFADADTLRRAFARHVGVSPAEYRKRFAGIAG